MKLLIMIFILTGCDSGVENQRVMELEVITDLHYFKDNFGVCYAMAWADAPIMIFTSVPCEKVGL
jgi:ABC-type spermidine/putrescine transport system permease subunit I